MKANDMYFFKILVLLQFSYCRNTFTAGSKKASELPVNQDKHLKDITVMLSVPVTAVVT